MDFLDFFDAFFLGVGFTLLVESLAVFGSVAWAAWAASTVELECGQAGDAEGSYRSTDSKSHD